MGMLKDYLAGLSQIRGTGEAVEETSYYGQLERLLNVVGGSLSPKVLCVLTTRNRGAGVPDGGLFTASRAVELAGRSALAARAPERGVVEVKGPGQRADRVARSAQVLRYLSRYGKVLVTTYREFLVLHLGPDGQAVAGESFSIAPDEESFWSRAASSTTTTADEEDEFQGFLRRALLGDAPLSTPADLAHFLAAYAREGRRRLAAADADLDGLAVLRTALEDSLGLRFDQEDGERFFRAALVQTLFYGVFAAWVVWSEERPHDSEDRFVWRSAQWTLQVPMVRVLFQQLATPAALPVGLDEVLDWTEEVLARVDRKLFFSSFEAGSAVQYFYEPFLQEYDPELRRELGVWYTPPEVVRYMVGRVHQALIDDLGLPLGLADENVYVLDPCTGTGSFLVETIETIARVVNDQYGDSLVGQDVKKAALTRIHGFELLPAPFVIAHMQVGLALDRLGAPLDAALGERAQVYLTNALTGWTENDEHPTLPFPEFEAERDAADAVKRTAPILVVLGNPPYNGFAGVSGIEEGGLVDPYKAGLAREWDITKNKLDDLYIRFWRVAERRIAEQTGRGIVCFISNWSWLGDPSAVVMRERLVREFDRGYIDALNGDSRETGKKTPDGAPDPSVFSTTLNPAGIQVGTAVSLLVRTDMHDDGAFAVKYRDFWGASKRADLEDALRDRDLAPPYEPLQPTKENWWRLRRWSPRHGYELWPSVVELTAEDPSLGLNENRAEALIDHDKLALAERIGNYLDPEISFNELQESGHRLTHPWARFNAATTRERLLAQSPFDAHRIKRFQVKPFDLRYAYIDTTTKLWNEPRKEYVAAAAAGSHFLLLRRRAPRALDGAAFLLSRCLIDQHVMHKDAYVVPFWLAARAEREDAAAQLFPLDPAADDEGAPEWRPNLSIRAVDYLASVGIDDAQTSHESAALLWHHVLAIGYSPLYLEENGDAIRNAWPRIPLPRGSEELVASARLGRRIADLLDLDTSLQGVDSAVDLRLRHVARIERTDGQALAPSDGDLASTAGWATEQTRKNQQTGVTSRIVMPGSGRAEMRERSDDETAGLDEEALDLLGTETVDVWLNERVCWRGVPEAVWDYKIGGFQVLRKWLSYRDRRILGRDLTVAETRQFTSICRRISEIVLLSPRLDASYIAVTESPHQERLAV
jgi:hypothetical protein